MYKLFGVALTVLLAVSAASAIAFPGDLVIMQGLDKVTARVSTFQAPLGTTVRFGTLAITVRQCDRTPPEEPPESSVFLEIVEIRPDEPPVPLFTGWMFSSSPALSALEHPVYDVWVLECRRTADEEAPAQDR
jgi:hypothetical protein